MAEHDGRSAVEKDSEVAGSTAAGAAAANATAEGAVPDKRALANAAFDDKVTVRAKLIGAVIFAAIFLFSFFSGTYSIAEGHSLGQIAGAIGEHMTMWVGQFAVKMPQALATGDPGTIATTFGSCVTGEGISRLVSDGKLDLALFNIRLPRIMLVLLVGAALSMAGGAFQGMFKNPLVSPDLLGASAGASLGACLAMLADCPNIIVQLGAFVGGLVAVSLTVWMRRMIKSDAILGLVLAGMLVSTLFQSGMSFVKLVADTNDKLPSITYWLMGSFHSVTKGDFWLAIVPMLLGFVLVYTQRWKLNVLSFGDEEARSMGVNTKRTRMIVILGATLVTSTSVAVAGIIGWIGLVIPHFARAIVGPNYKTLIPACLVFGSAYLLVIDDIARMAMSVEIPIGILTAILGVPFFLVIFRKTSKGW